MDTISLMEQILSSDNLQQGISAVVRNKGAGEIGRSEVHRTQRTSCKERRKHQGTVEAGKYKPQPVQSGDTKSLMAVSETWEYQQ